MDNNTVYYCNTSNNIQVKGISASEFPDDFSHMDNAKNLFRFMYRNLSNDTFDSFVAILHEKFPQVTLEEFVQLCRKISQESVE